jgi:signal transduction histidine kinase
LDNGLRVLVREDDGLPLVTLIASFKAGLLAETAANNGITHLLARVLHKGTARRTARELAEEIEAVGGSISSSSGNNSLSVAVHVMEPDLELGVRMLGEVLREASLPEEVISREKEVQLAGIRAEEEDVTVVARNFLREQLMGTHPYGLRAQGTAKSVESIRREDLVALRDRFVVGRNGVLSVFGKVRLAEVEALVDGVRPRTAQAMLSLQEEVARVTRLVEDFHQLAMSDLRALPCSFAPVKPADLLQDALARVQARAQAAGLQLALDAAGAPPMAQWDSQRVGQLLNGSQTVATEHPHLEAPGLE